MARLEDREEEKRILREMFRPDAFSYGKITSVESPGEWYWAAKVRNQREAAEREARERIEMESSTAKQKRRRWWRRRR